RLVVGSNPTAATIDGGRNGKRFALRLNDVFAPAKTSHHTIISEAPSYHHKNLFANAKMMI
ncbi:MAG: hypothetical protein FWE82_08745, partial [Defluviitaleaceae bacterium]|nr:hypothetical protein [Defluviitaleaceae bacterium]